MSSENQKRILLSELYPDLTPDEQIEAEENLRRYLVVVKRIFEHIVEHDPAILTEIRRRARLRKRGKSHIQALFSFPPKP